MRRIGPFTILSLCVACGGALWKEVPHDRPFQREPSPILHVRPRAGSTSSFWYAFVHTTLRPGGEAISPGHVIEAAVGGREALDVNAFGQVVDSTWFTNRIGRTPMTREEIVRGPNRIDGPAPGPLLVLGGKVEGATPGLVARDSAGNVFIVKFDPPAFPGLSSSAEVIATKILYAAGYNVPENFVADLRVDELRLSRHATTRGEYGERIPLDDVGLKAIVSHINPYRDGRIRAMFSRLIPGDALGSFDYRGCRADDPNDRVAHEMRRSLRGLWMFAAWLHNTDTRGANTLDMFLRSSDDPERGYVKHYLLDFGDALGAAGAKPKFAGEGYEHRIDWFEIHATLLTLGLHYPYWLPIHRSPYRSVGIFEAEIFEPEKWKPSIPNPAFDAATALDDYWAASIIARFEPELLAAIVESAGYTEPGAREWVLRVLMERQYRLLAHAFSRTLALDDPRMTDEFSVALTDLEVESSMLLSPDDVSYVFDVRWNRTGTGDVSLGSGSSKVPRLDLRPVVEELIRTEGDALRDDPFLTVRWRRNEGNLDRARPRPAVEVHLRVLRSGLAPVALDREIL